ncbi:MULTISPECIES: acyltransferase family protein [unclassified Agrococcus]|uniref:acyltransferase family protein n=1 Tax=unclassified Agrococcus TaxID=2615065 RepID=UPI00360675C8
MSHAPSALPASADRRSRALSIDALRGIAIVLLVVLHATEGLTFRFGTAGPAWLAPINELFMPFRMPTLMFLSGMLLGPSLAKPLGAYLLSKVRNLAWPYLIWSTVLLLTAGWTFFVVHYLPDPTSWIAVGYLWYLWYLLVFTLVAPFVRWIPTWISAAVCLTIALVLPSSGGLEGYMHYGTLFLLGHLFAQHRSQVDRALRRPATIAVLATLGVVQGLLAVLVSTTLTRETYMLPLTVAGIVASLVLLERAGSARWMRPLAWIGERSIVFYLVHWPVMVLTGWFVTSQGLDALWFPVNLVAAFAVATPLSFLVHRRPVRWLFQAPLLGRWVRRAGAPRRVDATPAAPAVARIPTPGVALPPVPPTPPLPTTAVDPRR